MLLIFLTEIAHHILPVAGSRTYGRHIGDIVPDFFVHVAALIPDKIGIKAEGGVMVIAAVHDPAVDIGNLDDAVPIKLLVESAQRRIDLRLVFLPDIFGVVHIVRRMIPAIPVLAETGACPLCQSESSVQIFRIVPAAPLMLMIDAPEVDVVQAGILLLALQSAARAPFLCGGPGTVDAGRLLPVAIQPLQYDGIGDRVLRRFTRILRIMNNGEVEQRVRTAVQPKSFEACLAVLRAQVQPSLRTVPV